MRLNIYDLFTVGVVRPDGGWSKGRPIAFIEEDDKCVPLFDLVIPNDLDEAGLARFVGGRFAAFARPGKRVVVLGNADRRQLARRDSAGNAWGTAYPAFAGMQR
jgi:hypothetical protein